MKKQEELYTTIHSLDSHELRYFRLYAQRHAGAENNASLKLFDIILSDKDISDKKLSVQHKIKNLARSKQYLLLLIHKSLFQYHDNESWQAKIKRYARMAEVFLDKGAYELAVENLERAEKAAQRVQSFADLSRLSEIRYTIYSRSGGLYPQFDFASFITTEQSYVRNTGRLVDARSILEKLKRIHHQAGSFKLDGIEDAYEQYLEEVKSALKKCIKGSEEEIVLRNALSLYYFNKSRTEECYAEMKRMVGIFQENPHLIQKDEFRYLISLSNLLNHCVRINKPKEIPCLLKALKEYETSSLALNEYIFVRYANFEAYRCVAFNKTNEIYQLLPYVRTNLEKFKLESRSVVAGLFYHLALCLMREKDYKEALKWNNKIISNSANFGMTGILYPNMIVNVVLNYELRDQEVLLSNIGVFQRQLSKRKTDERHEQIILSAMKKITNCKTKQKEAELFSVMIADLEAELKRHQQQMVMYGFDFVGWCRDKINQLKKKTA